MHDMPGRKSSGCPVAVCTAVGTIWRANKLGGLNITEYLQPRNSPREKSYSRKEAGSRPKRLVGKAADTDEETGRCSLWDRRGTGSSISGKDFQKLLRDQRGILGRLRCPLRRQRHRCRRPDSRIGYDPSNTGIEGAFVT